MPKIAVIPGDGIGPEVIREAVRVLDLVAAQHAFALEFEHWDLSAERFLKTGVTITEDEFVRLRDEYDALLLGALGDPRVPGNEHARDILLGLRFRLDLYVNLRPVRLIDAAFSPLRGVTPADVDLLIFRENTEGSYLGLGGSFKTGTPDEVAIEEDLNTRKGVERIVRAAFEYASTHGRRKVTLADKANAMRWAGGLWRRVFAEVGGEFTAVATDAMYVDALGLDLVLRPAHYDVIVTGNLFGDILSDAPAALVGGLGLAPSANLHPGRAGLFEPVHGSAPDIAGSGRANPVAAVLTAALMLRELGQPEAAERVERAVRRSIAGGVRTPDLGGNRSTSEVGDWLCRDLAEKEY